MLLAEGSVAGAAKRLRLSPSAMSRALARLRETTGDPLLVRAGRGLVPTPRAVELREQVSQLVQDAEAVLRPAEAAGHGAAGAHLHPAHQRRLRRELRRRRCWRASPREAPGVRLRFMHKTDKDSTLLRDGRSIWKPAWSADAGPEVRTQALFRDRLIGVVRTAIR